MHTFDDTNIPFYNTTTIQPDVKKNYFLGFLYLSISCIFYGINYLPVKHYEIGDGMFYQFIVSLGFFASNVVIYCFQGFPEFYVLPM